MLHIHEAAKILGVTNRQVRYLLDEGTLALSEVASIEPTSPCVDLGCGTGAIGVAAAVLFVAMIGGLALISIALWLVIQL